MPAPALELARLLHASRSAVALTGAGISVPSGIPDFRSPGTGLWEDVNPAEVAHIDAWRADPDRFWAFYGQRFQSLGDKAPNGAHRALAELEGRGVLKAVITQNIDQLHTAAGVRDLIEVHGSIAWAVDMEDGSRYDTDEVLARIEDAEDGVPRSDAGRPLKPDVVLFGEFLDAARLERAFTLAAEADLLVCIGSSLEVHPIAQLPGITQAAGGRVALVTAGPTPWDRRAAVKLDGDVEEELEAVLEALDGLAAAEHLGD